MFNFLKRFFGKETERCEVKLEDLHSWFKDKTNHYSSELDNYVNEKSAGLDAIKKNISEGMQELEEAKIQDEEKIIPKVKSVVLAARQNYIRELSHLIKDINIDSSDKKAVVESCKMAQLKLDMFAQKTAKSYFTTQHLFHKPLEALAGYLKELSKIVKELNDSVKESKMFKAEKIAGMISELSKDINLLEEWEKSAKRLEEKKKETENNIKNKEKDIEELKKTKEYMGYNQDIDKIKKLKEKLKIKGNAIFELLAPLSAVLKKYERITMEGQDIIKRYINDPVKALLDDDSVVICDILMKIRKSADKGSLELNEKRKEKAIRKIDSIKKDELERLKKDYAEVEEEINRIKDRIERNDVQENQEELLKKKDKAEDELNSVERDINELKGMAGKIDIEKEKKDIINKIKELLDIEVVLG